MNKGNTCPVACVCVRGDGKYTLTVSQQKSKTTKPMSVLYITLNYQMEKLWRMRGTISFPLLPSPLW